MERRHPCARFGNLHKLGPIKGIGNRPANIFVVIRCNADIQVQVNRTPVKITVGRILACEHLHFGILRQHALECRDLHDRPHIQLALDHQLGGLGFILGWQIDDAFHIGQRLETGFDGPPIIAAVVDLLLR